MRHRLQSAQLAICLIVALVSSFNAFGTTAPGTTNESAVNKSVSVDELNKQLFNTQQSIRTLQSKVAEQQQKLATTQEQSQPVLEEYFKARQHMQSLKEQIERDGSLHLASQYKTEELKFIMVEGRYEEANGAIVAEQEQLATLEKRLSWQQGKARKLVEQKSQAVAAIKQAEQAEIKRQQKEASAIAASNASAQAELQKLRELLAKRDQELAKAQATIERSEQEKATVVEIPVVQPSVPPTTAALKSSPGTSAATTKTNESLVATEAVQAEAVNPATANTSQDNTVSKTATTSAPTAEIAAIESTAVPAKAIVADSAADKPAESERVVIITDRDQAKLALDAFSEKARSGSKNRSDKIVKVRNLSKNRSMSKVMAAKGNDQYRVKLRLRGGSNEFKVGRTVIVATLPESDALTNYVALLDNQLGNQKLVLIEHSALK